MDSSSLLRFAGELADTAARITMQHFRTPLSVENKFADGFDPVTAADREAERALRAKIAARFPGHGIRGEEFPETHGSEPYRWVLDPVDGTRAFICGVPVWTTLIGLEHQGRPVLGVIDQPCLKERWVGYHGKDGETELTVQGFHNGGTSDVERLKEAKMMVTDIRADAYFTEDEAAAVGALARQVRLLRQGLDSYGFGLVAGGQMDLVVEAGLHWHDIAAVIPVIEAAGGVVTDWQGAPVRDNGGGGGTLQVIVAATPALAEAAGEALRT
ncbi:inositol monophosphatase family protein [Parvularcula maris]|uniref:Inositol monophosphatase family protein n=1 Tax=Parvularcula maris TaxID=2965077 RepID=A0A9X2RKS7_9PROT|nr:inositol monophosphatase family protein [Parvularcula maris]MCQ8185912.1 inositol monophosphatase family protein [Parvularcula maris]